MYPCEFMCSVKKTILFSSSSMDEGLIKRPFIASPPPYFSPPRHHFRIGKNFAIIALPPLYIFNRGKYRLYRFATTLIFNWGILHSLTFHYHCTFFGGYLRLKRFAITLNLKGRKIRLYRLANTLKVNGRKISPYSFATDLT